MLQSPALLHRWLWHSWACHGVLLTAADFACMLLSSGDYRILKARGLMNKPKGFAIIKAAVSNYRTWILAMTYGYSFGVELTVDNVISQCVPQPYPMIT
jgi:NNP family nitrate/nitrite transporter-like MFS transporter